MNYSIKAKPTRYNDRNFRSRLEAKWACFFDLLGWKWEYEPFDLNGWMPDFLLIGEDQQILVEVKPFSKIDQFKDVLKKIKKANPKDEVLLLGNTLIDSSCFIFEKNNSLGWLIDRWDEEQLSSFSYKEISNAIFNYNKNKWGFFHEYNSYQDRITGEYDGDGHLCFPKNQEQVFLWKKAGDTIQYQNRNWKK